MTPHEPTDELFISVRGERDILARKLLRVETALNQIARGELTLHENHEGWHFKRHPKNIHPRGPDCGSALEAVFSSQPGF